jgi:hypothetical protein
MMIAAILPFATKLLDKVWPDPATKAEAEAKLLELAQTGELAKMANETELFKAEATALTVRHENDMQSDSWMSKNIRPMVLIYLMVLFTLAFFMNVPSGVLEMLRDLLMLAFGFYFSIRGAEKIAKIITTR